MRSWFDIKQSISVKPHINKPKKKNPVIIPADAEKTLDKIQHSFMINILNKVGLEGTYMKIIKTIYENQQ